MISFKPRNILGYEKDSFLEIIKKIKDGDVVLRNKFIDDFKPFILKCVYQMVGQKDDLEQCDEYSIALIAFNEAIEAYDLNRKTKFVSFSKQVIRRRLIDYLRSTKRNNATIPFSCFNEYESNSFEEMYLHDKGADYSSDFDFKEEIKNLELKMCEYKVKLEDLIKCSPKHRDTICSCLNIANLIIEDKSLYEKFATKKTLPYKELTERVKLCRRTLERNRKFIIAMVFVLKSELEVLKKYIYDTIGR